MNLDLFIAKRIIFNRDLSFGKMSRPVIRISVLAIALGIAVMIISVSVLTGFQKQITEKVIGFGAHIQITPYDNNSSLQTPPVSRNQPFYASLNSVPGVKHVQVFATKGGIIKTPSDIGGIVLKGVDSDYDWSYFSSKIVAGNIFSASDTGKKNNIIISRQTANKLKFNVGDNLIMYFIQQPPRVRKFTVCGIYQTGLEDFDTKFGFVDIRHIQKLNDWDSTQVAGFEVLVNNFEDLDQVAQEVANNVDYSFSVQTIKQLYSQLFDWLNLQDVNVIVILVMMVTVGLINMITALLILILERTNMIGILKALGASNWSLRKIFLANALYLIFRGLLFGNIFGIGLCILQQHYGLIKLDQSSYYVSQVPININYLYILLLNAGTALVCVCFLVVPSYLITKITPIKAIRFS
jgi:lipoprotein-releasing system permease protein